MTKHRRRSKLLAFLGLGSWWGAATTTPPSTCRHVLQDFVCLLKPTPLWKDVPLDDFHSVLERLQAVVILTLTPVGEHILVTIKQWKFLMLLLCKRTEHAIIRRAWWWFWCHKETFVFCSLLGRISGRRNVEELKVFQLQESPDNPFFWHEETTFFGHDQIFFCCPLPFLNTNQIELGRMSGLDQEVTPPKFWLMCPWAAKGNHARKTPKKFLTSRSNSKNRWCLVPFPGSLGSFFSRCR